MCVACVEHETERRPAAGPAIAEPRVTWDDIDRVREMQRKIYSAEIAAGVLVRCGACGAMTRPADGENGILRRGWCLGCENQWIEDNVLLPLVERLGRKGARKALRRLAAGK